MTTRRLTLAVVLIGLRLATGASAQGSCTITVTSAADAGTGSLRAAISSANASANADTICFSIGSGPQTISPSSQLPSLSRPVTVDATTQPSFSGTPLVSLDGSGAGSSYGLLVASDGGTVRGLSIGGFGKDGIFVTASGVRIAGNYIGTDGSQARGNAWSGIGVISSDNVIGGTATADRNVVSGNGQTGIVVCGSSADCGSSGANGNTIRGNFIGTNAAGTGAIANGSDGVLIVNAASNTLATNIISGNTANGVGIWKAAATHNVVTGNFVGTDVSGSRAIPNGDIGIESQDAPDNTIGGAASARNVVSGNTGAGVSLTGSRTTGNSVSGNYVGTNAAGSAALANRKMGINIGSVDGGSSNANRNTISGNLIAGNTWSGIYISGSTGGHNQIQGNTIGGAVPNQQDGIGILNSPGNVVGGQGRNVLSNNGGNGVAIVGDASNGNRVEANDVLGNKVAGVSIGGGVDNAILANSIDVNAFMGIDVNPGGVTHNDKLDPDGGPNRQQNFPELSRVLPAGTIEGTINTTAATQLRIEFFHSPACGRGGYGQGRNYIGGTTVTTDGNGNAGIGAAFPGIPSGAGVTAVAIVTAGGAPGDSSEFSNCVVAAAQTAPGTPRPVAPKATPRPGSGVAASPVPSPDVSPATESPTGTPAEGVVTATDRPDNGPAPRDTGSLRLLALGAGLVGLASASGLWLQRRRRR